MPLSARASGALALLIVLSCGLFFSSCKRGPGVVIYVALDRQMAEPVLQQFQSETGVPVRAIYDTEANKTSGLVNRLMAESKRPRADLFWNNEPAQMQRLSDAGILQVTNGANTKAFCVLKQCDGAGWNGFAARLRTLVVHASVASGEEPASLEDFGNAAFEGRAAVANPRFGTTGTHFAALLVHWGELRFRSWLRALRLNHVAVLPGNAQVKNAVVEGRYEFGLTDTDDALEALREAKPVRMVFLDQGARAMGTLVVPNALGLVVGGPRRAAAEQLASYLLSEPGERLLAAGPGGQLPIRHDIRGPESLPGLNDLRIMEVDYAEVGRAYVRMLQIVDEEWPP